MAGKTDDREARRAAAEAAYIEVAFDDAFEIREQSAKLTEARKANREQLRGFAAQGKLDDDQLALVEELYPTRVRNSGEEGDGEPSGESSSEPTPEPANA